MNRKEIREIKKRFKPEADNFSHIYGCYVNAAKEVVSEMDLQIMTMTQEEKEMYMNILKKTLSGSLGRNLVDLEFATEQVGSSDEHTMLQALRMSGCGDENMREVLYRRIIESLDMEEKSYVILLAADSYDVPYKATGDEDWDEDSTDQFDYFVCCICPVKDSKSALRYFAEEKNFREASTGTLLSAPIAGFMFPAFDGRATNIYNALYYTRSASDIHEELIQAVFNVPRIPMAAASQKDAFDSALNDALGDECRMDVVKSLHVQIQEKVQEYKESREPGVPEIDIDDVSEMLMKSGVSDDRISDFTEECRRNFGDQTVLNPGNLIESRKFEVKTPEARIAIDPEHIFTLKTRVIDGTEYLMIPMGEGVVVNGVDVHAGERDDGDGSAAGMSDDPERIPDNAE